MFEFTEQDFTATDACSKLIYMYSNIYMDCDSTPPTFTACPSGSTLGCNPTGVPAAGSATATDACGSVTITSALGSVFYQWMFEFTEQDLHGNRMLAATHLHVLKHLHGLLILRLRHSRLVLRALRLDVIRQGFLQQVLLRLPMLAEV